MASTRGASGAGAGRATRSVRFFRGVGFRDAGAGMTTTAWSTSDATGGASSTASASSTAVPAVTPPATEVSTGGVFVGTDSCSAGPATASSAMVAAATIAPMRAGWVEPLLVVSSTSEPVAEPVPGAFDSPCLRPVRSAAVVSVVSAAATRWLWRFVDAAAAARLRAAGVAAAEVREVRAAFAASPRAAAAFDEAARDAALRFDGVGACVSASDAPAAAAAAPFAAPLAVPFAAPPFAAPLAVLFAARSTDGPLSADTPVPVPSGASSS